MMHSILRTTAAEKKQYLLAQMEELLFILCDDSRRQGYSNQLNERLVAEDDNYCLGRDVTAAAYNIFIALYLVRFVG
eukprot:Gb_31216 [translate_table: standard]